MKIDEKIVTMTGDEFEIFSRLIETVKSQEKVIRKLVHRQSVRTRQEVFTQISCWDSPEKLPS